MFSNFQICEICERPLNNRIRQDFLFITHCLNEIKFIKVSTLKYVIQNINIEIVYEINIM